MTLKNPKFSPGLFVAYVTGSMNYDAFRQVGFAIDHCSLSDLFTLRNHVSFEPHRYDEGVGAYVYESDSDAAASRLASAGILFHDGNGVIVTDIGMVLTKIIRN
jgi:hypothetical protein